MFDPSRADVRRFFCETWRKHRERLPLSPLEAIALDAILLHPEYHTDLASLDDALAREYPPEAGGTNPFLHLSLHLAVAEQLQIDQPRGIRSAWQRLAARLDEHEATHAVIECLAEAVWSAQREGRELDGRAYLDCVEGKGEGGRGKGKSPGPA
ncbi:MAG: DUF1841 family protein [Burkholderiaceae bacterium]|nr:DUF1841 family protein [Burkholderiaceae bacterium]